MSIPSSLTSKPYVCCDLHPKALTNCPAPSCPMKKAGKERDTMLTSSGWTKSNQEVASYSQLIWYKNYLSLIILPCLTRYLSELARCSPTSQHAKSSHKQLFGTTSFQHLFMAKLGCFFKKTKQTKLFKKTRKSQADRIKDLAAHVDRLQLHLQQVFAKVAGLLSCLDAPDSLVDVCLNTPS